MPNIKQIAKMANVSLGTVSHVLNGTASVREPLRKRVLEAIDALGYRPNQLARGLRRDKTDIIGMIIPDITNPFFPAVVRGAEDVAFSSGYRLVLCNTDNDHKKELAHLNALRTYLSAGLILIPSNSSDLTPHLESYRKAGAAVVCVDRLLRQWDGDSVTVSNEEGAYRATRLLIQMQHRRVAMITGPLSLAVSSDRLNGFKRAMREAAIGVLPEYIQESTFDKGGGHTKGMVLLRMSPRPTAFFAANDMIALGILLAIREMDLRCPEDVSVIGFDDLDLAENTSPSLSSVYQPGYQLGATAARMLFDRISGDKGPARHTVLQTELRIRESIAAASTKIPSSALPAAAKRAKQSHKQR